MNSILLASSLTPIASIEGALALCIPIVAIIMPFAFVVGIIAINARKNSHARQLQHETLRLMVEKGQPIPPEMLKIPEEPEKKKSDDRKTGLILIAVGIGIFIFFQSLGMQEQDAFPIRWAGASPGLVGVALLANWFLTRKERAAEAKKNSSAGNAE